MPAILLRSSLRRLVSGALIAGLLATVASAADDLRFSRTLTPEQRARVGLDALSSDNIAVIDGLVRQDQAATAYKDNAVEHTRFSERRTAHERSIAGLDQLTADQVTQLDKLIEPQVSHPSLAGAATFAIAPGTGAMSSVQAASYVRPVKMRGPEIHGQASYTYGWSKCGTIQGGELVLEYADPAKRYAVLVGYGVYKFDPKSSIERWDAKARK